MGLTKAQREERKAYAKKLYEEGYSINKIAEMYDAKFGTHYAYWCNVPKESANP